MEQQKQTLEQIIELQTKNKKIQESVEDKLILDLLKQFDDRLEILRIQCKINERDTEFTSDLEMITNEIHFLEWAEKDRKIDQFPLKADFYSFQLKDEQKEFQYIFVSNGKNGEPKVTLDFKKYSRNQLFYLSFRLIEKQQPIMFLRSMETKQLLAIDNGKLILSSKDENDPSTHLYLNKSGNKTEFSITYYDETKEGGKTLYLNWNENEKCFVFQPSTDNNNTCFITHTINESYSYPLKRELYKELKEREEK